jgi:hypothetical protein
MQGFDPDTAAVTRDEVRNTAAQALAAHIVGQMPPLGTPLQREMAGIVTPIWWAQQHREAQARLAVMRRRAQH